MKNCRFIAILGILLSFNCSVFSQDIPSIDPVAEYESGEVTEDIEVSGDAPLVAHFRANPQNQGAYTSYYEWRFTREGEKDPYIIRYEEDTDYTFTEAGTHLVECYAIFTNGNAREEYTEEYWASRKPFKITISESSLVMPNAFSPNGDKNNDTYKVKSYKSIVEFHAAIYNRWGQKIYEWDNPDGEWDGTFNGHDVKEGVYFVVVKAKGSDGRIYNKRRDVNLLRHKGNRN